MIVEIGRQTVFITSFVIAMMLLVEYLNVLTGGAWRRALGLRGPTQYLVAAALGLVPGCLGAFVVVAMFAHRVVSLGAVLAAMVATTGDETFVMLALFPGRTLLISAILAPLGIASGWLFDRFLRRFASSAAPCPTLALHEEDHAEFPTWRSILRSWSAPSSTRGILCAGLILFILGVAAGEIASEEGLTIRVTVIVVAGLALLISASVPDHFLEEHLWAHVIRKHARGVFLWTLAALAALQLVDGSIDLQARIQEQEYVTLLAAAVVGLIPCSGPHLAFVLLYARGNLPFGVLLANSIVQDGHGLLPLLAHSRRDFILIKAVKLVLGLAAGLLAGLAGL
ncbi:MAG: arsenic efflux protein [Planctomycetes bacterium]|nr:arsenic efflux protein [Planctomycetota bacterium]